MALSDAVSLSAVSRIVGYKLETGDFSEVSPNLPQRIAILGEANTANQGTLDLDPISISSAKQAGDIFGYGSPLHSIMRILRPATSTGVGSIPTIVYPQAEAVGAVAKEITISVTGTATENATHTLVINGRTNLDGANYSFTVVEGDTNAVIAGKISDAVNRVLSAPASAATSTADSVITSKWKGVTSEELNITVSTGGVDAGMTYAINSTASGVGAVDIASSLAKFANEWNTIVINPYSAATWDALELFNGIPDPVSPTGRYTGIVFKPFVALTGATESTLSALEAKFDAANRKNQVTNVICPAPNSSGFTWEAAANGASLFATIMNDTPHLDISGRSYADMPVPADGDIGEMLNYTDRDFTVKAGYSTVDFKNGAYEVQDFVTTYHPDGEAVPQFRYPRNLEIDWNVRYGYLLLEEENVRDHSIAENDQPVNVPRTIKPKQWIQLLNTYAEDLATRNLIVEVLFMTESITVKTSTTNPDRFETFFRYKRSPFVRIAATTAQAGFAFGLS